MHSKSDFLSRELIKESSCDRRVWQFYISEIPSAWNRIEIHSRVCIQYACCFQMYALNVQMQTWCTLLQLTLLSVHNVCLYCMHKVCICILGAHYYVLHSYEFRKCAQSLHIVCKCILIAYLFAVFVRYVQGLHWLFTFIFTFCTLLILYKI